MLPTVITGLIWVVALFVLIPSPNDLKTPKPKRVESIKKILGTVFLGLILIFVFYFTTQGSFVESKDTAYTLLGINNVNILTPIWLVQLVTNIFVHANWVHLLSNLTLLGILSLYEREIGTQRYLILFILSGVFASFSVLLNTSPIVSAGASGALFGLAGAYVLHTALSGKSTSYLEITSRILLLAILFIFITFQTSQYQIHTNSVELTIDTWGHLLGLLTGCLLSKFLPDKL